MMMMLLLPKTPDLSSRALRYHECILIFIPDSIIIIIDVNVSCSRSRPSRYSSHPRTWLDTYRKPFHGLSLPASHQS